MSTPTIDFSKYEQQAPAPSIDFSKYESKPAAPDRTASPEYQSWKKSRAEFEAMPLPKRMWMMATQPNSVPDPDGPAHAPGSFEGHPENVGEYAVATGGRAAEGVVDMSRGNLAMGAHKLIQAGSNAIAPMAPIMAAGAPVMAARAVAGGYAGSKVAGAGAQALGASPDQQALAEDAGNIVGGGAAATGALRAVLESPTKALVSRAAQAAESKISPDMAEFLGPKVRAGLRMLSSAGKMADSADAANVTGLGTLVKKHSDAIAETSDKLNAALAKANALPPEGPTAQFKDVPDLRVQPSQQPPLNLLEQRKAAFQAAQRGAQGEFQVNSPESTPQQLAQIKDVMGNVQIRPQGATDAPPSILRATGQPTQAGGRVTPNMEIYNEEIQPPPALKPPTLLQQLRQWDNIRQIHSQLEDQIGKGQDEIQQWMEDHNQEGAGGKSTAAKQAKARFDAARAKASPGPNEPRVPTSDEEMQELLMKSVQAAKAKKARAAAGD